MIFTRKIDLYIIKFQSKKFKWIFSFIIFHILSIMNSFGQLHIQDEVSKIIEEDYYMFPIRPGLNNFLAGTMGELRQSHFHAGLDIKTGGVEGLPVYASADGYISRINVSSFGYGNALYIKHPNGNTSVYAHLQKFANDIHHYVKSEQYSKESFDVELNPDPQQFQIKKGQIIALSGNSGSSGGPHLHFEIRDEFQKPLNPLKYKFAEIKDNIPPTAVSIAIKTMDVNARVNNQFGYFIFNLSREGNKYTIKEPVHVQGKVGIEILAYDQMNDSNNQNGVPCIDLYLNDKKIFTQNIETFAFYEGRNILVHSNYQEMVRTGKRYNKLYVDHGNELSFYQSINRGIINITDNADHKVKINLFDPFNNISNVQFTLTGKTASNIKKEEPAQKNGYEISNNTLQIYNSALPEQTKLVKLFSNRMAMELSPSYSVKNTDVYLWDLRFGLPDSLDLCGEMIRFNLKSLIPVKTELNYFHPAVNILFKQRSLFDTLYLKVNHTFTENQEFFKVNEDNIPLREYVNLTLRPIIDYPDKKGTSVYSINKKGNPVFIGGIWKDNDIEFRTRNFGEFTLLSDSIPPTIKVIKASNTECRFQIKDDLSGLKSFRATIGGQWLLMNYDHKKNLIWSEKSDNTIPFKGDFELVVVDNAGNETIFTTKF